MPSTKFVIVIPDGAATSRFAGLDGLTPLQAARFPRWTGSRAKGSSAGPETCPTASCPPATWRPSACSVTTPSVITPAVRRLEAAAMGIELGPDDWAVRCNLMTIRDGRLTDFTAGHITSAEGRSLIEAIQAELGRTNDRVSPRGQLPQPDDLPGPAELSPVHRRDRDRPASRPSRPACGGPSAARPGRGSAQRR